MSSSNRTSARKTRQKSPVLAASPAPYRLWLWLIFFAASLFFIPQCLDRYLVSRFFFLSVVLLGAVLTLWKVLYARADWRLHGFDLLLLTWYGMNAVSVFWAFSWSEGVFYTCKVLLLFAVYWLVRQAFLYDAQQVRATLVRITAALTLVVSVLLILQFGVAIREHGLDNQRLYDYASGVFGNKGLATDFLFFLLILNLLFRREFAGRFIFPVSFAVLLVLILLLQTRTVYLALVAGMLLYLPLRGMLEPEFRPVLFRRIIPGIVTGVALLAALVSWKGRGTSLAERLNPATYLESASANERRFVWYKTDELNKDHFWWGVGNGSWKFLFPSKSIEGGYRLQEQNIVFTRAHNDYLEVRAEMGMTGAMLFIALFVAAFLAALVALRQSAAPEARSDLPVLLAGLAGYCVIQYFDFPRERIEMQALLGLYFAMLAYHSRAVWASLPGLSIQRVSRVFLALLAAGMLFNIVVGWKRIQGEIHNVKALKAQASGNYPVMQREAAAAVNSFYEYNDVALPLSWLEGIAWYQMNRMPEALGAFEQAYRLNPWAFQVINNYATALVRSGKYSEAITLFEKALAINPRYDEGIFNVAYSWYSLGQYDKALDWLSRIDTISDPSAPAEARKKNQAVLQQKASLQTAIRTKQQ